MTLLPLDKTEIRSTGVHMTRIGMGGAPIGGLYTAVEAEAAVGTIRRAHELGVGYFDTAPLYGSGRSEMLFGDALEGIPRADYVLSTKVGRLLEPVAGAARERPVRRPAQPGAHLRLLARRRAPGPSTRAWPACAWTGSTS